MSDPLSITLLGVCQQQMLSICADSLEHLLLDNALAHMLCFYIMICTFTFKTLRSICKSYFCMLNQMNVFKLVTNLKTVLLIVFCVFVTRIRRTEYNWLKFYFK